MDFLRNSYRVSCLQHIKHTITHSIEKKSKSPSKKLITTNQQTQKEETAQDYIGPKE